MAELVQVQVSSPTSNGDSPQKHPSRLPSSVSGREKAGLRIVFKDLTYSVKSRSAKGQRANLLKNVNGYFEPMQMAALMGPSGSGKTTLLDVLAGRKTDGKQEGSVLFSGQKPSVAFLRRYTGYVEQFDTLLGQLTVYEMLLYTAEMKRPMSETLASKKEAVNELLRKLALETCRDVPIGNALSKGISGGQAKRTNIGIALVTNPRVLFLDEPTSGLDSYTSNEVMTVVKALVNDGTTICATIHSPSSYTFNLFDRVIMLVRGQVVYFGDRGHSMIEFVKSSCPDVKEYVAGYNDAEYVVDLITEADRLGKGEEFAAHYEQSPLCRENMDNLEQYIKEDHLDLPPDVQEELKTKRATATPWWWGFLTLLKYRTTKNYRDPAFLGPRIGDKLMISLLIMTLYLGIGNDFYPENYINISAVLFMWTTLPAFGAAAYIPAIVLERSLFVRERHDGMYRVFTYLLAKMFDELLITGVVSVGIAAYTFYGIQLQGEFVLFWLTYYITLSTGIVLAYFIAALSPNMDVANALLPTYVVTLLFFGGFLMQFDKMPDYWYWYSYIDFLRYAWGALMVNQFNNNDPAWNNDLTVLETYSLENVKKWAYVGYLSLFFLTFFLLSWTTLGLRKYSNR